MEEMQKTTTQGTSIIQAVFKRLKCLIKIQHEVFRHFLETIELAQVTLTDNI